MATFYGYGKEILYYANSIDIKFTKLFDHILSNKEKYPIVNELVESYIKSLISLTDQPQCISILPHLENVECYKLNG